VTATPGAVSSLFARAGDPAGAGYDPALSEPAWSTPPAVAACGSLEDAVLVDHAGIAALVPHAGSMCLLQALLAWDEAHIVCRATSHRALDNPLRTAAGLSATAAIEYAGQAMALHGALLARAQGAAMRPGMLASARSVELHRLRLDDLAGALQVSAWRLAGDERQILYRFELSHQGEPVVSGRAAVVLELALGAA
jgi:predicted hotdog family 3-hydroxylacyl-ACP dehydratase